MLVDICGTVESAADLIMMMSDHGNLIFMATVKYKAVTTERLLLIVGPLIYFLDDKY